MTSQSVQPIVIASNRTPFCSRFRNGAVASNRVAESSCGCANNA